MIFQGNIYKKHSFVCHCGKEHRLNIEEVVIEPGARLELPRLIKKLNFGNRGLLVTDTFLYNRLGDELLKQWQLGGLELESCILAGIAYPDEMTVGKIFCKINKEINFLVALGTGTITDTVRFVATKMDIPCVVIPTAMTMDGFFTDMSLIVIDGLKTTFAGKEPSIVLGDMDIISKAPVECNVAGIGEVASKISSVMDWYAAFLIKGDHYCKEIEDLMVQCVHEGFCTKTIHGIPKGDLKALEDLTDALYKSAVAMSWYGSARCAAGAEHHLTHYWGMCHEKKGMLPHMHGHEVGVGAVVNLMLWDEMLRIDYSDFNIEEAINKVKTEEEWRETVQKVFGKSAENVYLEQKNKFFNKDDLRNDIRAFLKARKDINERFISLPSAEVIARKLQQAGAPYSPTQLGIEKDELIESLYFAKEMRSKYTSLWIADTLGLFDNVMPRIMTRVDMLGR